MTSPAIWAYVYRDRETGRYRYRVHARGERHHGGNVSEGYVHRTDCLRALEAITRTRALVARGALRLEGSGYVLRGYDSDGGPAYYPLHIDTGRPWKGWHSRTWSFRPV